MVSYILPNGKEQSTNSQNEGLEMIFYDCKEQTAVQETSLCQSHFLSMPSLPSSLQNPNFLMQV